jgi:hypothetical protein
MALDEFSVCCNNAECLLQDSGPFFMVVTSNFVQVQSTQGPDTVVLSCAIVALVQLVEFPNSGQELSGAKLMQILGAPQDENAAQTPNLAVIAAMNTKTLPSSQPARLFE